MLGQWVWRVGPATSQPAFGLGKSNLPHREGQVELTVNNTPLAANYSDVMQYLDIDLGLKHRAFHFGGVFHLENYAASIKHVVE